MAVLDEEERDESATYKDSRGAHFPMPDKNHARLALAMIKHAPSSEQPKIRARATRMLGRGGRRR
jgi:hypothetical protein